MIPMLSGGAYRRPGTLFDSKLTGNVTYPRLIPFVVSQIESYMLALYRQPSTPFNGIVAAFRPGSNFGPSTPSTVTGGHSYIYDASVLMEEYDQVQYAQSIDVMTLVHPKHKPKQVLRTSTDNFTVQDFDAGLSGAALRDAWPYFNQNITAITMTASATSGSGITLTASVPFFNAGHVGAIFKQNDGTGTIGSILVTAFTSATVVVGNVITNFGSTGARATWWESAWSDYRGWPRTVTYYKQRIAYGGSATDPDSIWFSGSANFPDLSVAALVVSNSAGDGTSTGPKGSQPFQLDMVSNQLNEIQWMSPDKTLTVGTIGDEYIVDLEQPGGFGADNVSCTPQGHSGSSYHPAVRCGVELMFAQQSNDTLASLTFNLIQNSYASERVKILFDEYPKPTPLGLRRFRHFAWDESRATLWCIDTAGNLFGMTHDQSLKINAWHTHKMGGFDGVTDTDMGMLSGSVMSLALLPNPLLGVNDVWLTVVRSINGSDQFHIERFMGRHISSDSAYGANLALSGNYYTDSCVTDVNKFSLSDPEDFVSQGLHVNYSHLEGATVTGTADSAQGVVVLPPSVVASSAVPLEKPYPPDYTTIDWNISFGLAFPSVVLPVRIEAGSQIGTAQGAIKRIHKLTIRFYKTLSAKFGPSSDQLETITFRKGETPMNNSPELFTGDMVKDFDGDYDRDGYIYLLQDQPLPFSVISIIAEGMTDD